MEILTPMGIGGLTPFPIVPTQTPMQMPNQVPAIGPTQPGATTRSAANQEAGLPKRDMGILDSILFAILGPPDAMMTKEDRAETQQGRQEAGALAQSAAKSPGKAHMGIPSGGGGDLRESLGDIVRIMSFLG